MDEKVSIVGDVAKLDFERETRCGMPEVVLAEGKETDALVEIVRNYALAKGRCVVSRISDEQADTVCGNLPEGFTPERRKGGILIVSDGRKPVPSGGVVGIITAGTSDIRVAEEARAIAEELGINVGTVKSRLSRARKKVAEILPDANIYTTRAGCTISSHCGRNTLGVLFIKK